MFFASLLAMAFVCFGGFLMFVVFVGALSTLSQPEPTVKKGSVLVFNLNARIQDSPVSRTSEELIEQALGRDGPKTYSHRSVMQALEKAATDDRIKALLLKGSLDSSGGASGFATLREIREGILEFKSSGKPVIAYTVYPSARDLYVMSTADEFIMNPEGMIGTAGMVSQPIFFKGFFDKYGIGVQVTKAGEYKSYAEPYVRDGFSGPARKQIKELLDDLWGEFVAVVADRAGIEESAFQALIDEKYLLAEDAVAIGLVDDLGHAEKVIDIVKRAIGSSEKKSEFKNIGIGSYVRAILDRKSSSEGHIAVVYAEGVIVGGEGQAGEIGGDRLAREIRELRENDDVKAIVLRVNSPGGSAVASEMIQHELRLAKEKMPIVVSMGTVAASGGYWISAYGNRIFAEPNTITGSIGVIGLFFNLQEIASNHGFTFDTVKTGKFADALSLARPKTDEEMAMIQALIDITYSQFLDKVAEGRGIPLDEIKRIAEGRVWSGIDAKELKLVDEIGGLEDAIAYAAGEVGLGDSPEVRDYPKPVDFVEELIEELAGKAMFRASLETLEPIDAAIEMLEQIARCNDPKGVYALMPYKFNIK